jgi:hypothetical protein
MITLYQVVCKEEYDKTKEKYLSYFRNKEKAFGTFEFIINRVCDGKFNNSKFKNKYEYLIKIEFDEKYKQNFHRLN